MINIRKYKPEDKIHLERICIETSSLPVETQKQRDYLMLMYSNYYTEVEGENCFVAVDDNDIPVGYILCAEDFNRYYKTFKSFYLPEIRELGLSYYIMAVAEITGHRLFSKKYRAHLHIDILDVCQGQGVGTRLVASLKNHLKTKGQSSVMLSCGGNNTGAVKFYKKNDFFVVKNLAGSYIMASEF